MSDADLSSADLFAHRHIGPRERDVEHMLATLGYKTLDDLIYDTIPASIRLNRPLNIGPMQSEHDALTQLRALAEQNRVCRSMIGMGYSDTITPAVIRRNILENPGWYTQYTPYQPEISQGRLEALLNFQTMVADLTGLPIANASLLDEATAAAEAMHMCAAVRKDGAAGGVFFVADDCHPQTIAVVKTRARPLGIDVRVTSTFEMAIQSFAVPDVSGGAGKPFGVLLQYPNTYGTIFDYSEIIQKAHAAGALVVMATDLLALTLIKPPGEFGADIAIGNSQRFGVPLGFGGPHAAFMACKDEYKRLLPGRLVGVSKDAHGKPAYRLALATREQHIRREKATSNICTAQVLLAVIAGMYAVYHGPGGLRRIATRVHEYADMFADAMFLVGHEVVSEGFDSVRVRPSAQKGAARDAAQVRAQAESRGLNFRYFADGTIGVSLDETIDSATFQAICESFGGDDPIELPGETSLRAMVHPIPAHFARTSQFLAHLVFHQYHSEHELLRYIKRLESRDLSLTTSMIPLGSCTMKLNAAAEMLPVTWPEFGGLHPYAPAEQWKGYAALFAQLENWLAEITGFAAVSLQPNAGSQGEYAGLLAIRGYHESRGESHRNICLIPVSAHGTNPASAVMAGMKVVAVACDAKGNIDVPDLRAKAETHAKSLAALMVTYPSTHGVFEEPIREICDVVHRCGGQVYMDGANMNAQVGLCRPADIGADVCHLNLHKTFCIPHGGGGPGMGPIGVAEHLAPFLPGDPLGSVGMWESGNVGKAEGSTANSPNASSPSHLPTFPSSRVGPVSAAPYGSPSILPISWMYIAMMGSEGLKRATQVAILSANYMAKRLEQHYPVLYTGRNGRVAHEFILDCRPLEATSGVKVEDIAKRLMDYGFHAPTMSFPVAGTLMIEPTESESREELDRLCDALIAIREEIRAIEQGRMPRNDNPLKNAPHTARMVTSSEWTHPYPREQAAFPAAWVREHKFWPPVSRVDNVYGDRNLFCTCVPVGNAE